MKPLKDIEKILIHYAIIAEVEDWNLLYKCVIGEDRYNNLSAKSKQVGASKWKNSEQVQEEYRIRQYEQHKRQEEQRRKETERERETEPTRANKAEVVNFLDRDDFLKFLNARANEITDDKLRNDILKMLSDNMRYKEAEKDTENEIQRFYTPQICENCIIYNKCKSCTLTDCPKVIN